MDYYLNTTDKEALLAELQVTIEGDYYQDENFILDWVGKIPDTVDPETGEVLTWIAGDHLNVRVLNPEYEATFENLANATLKTPPVPYRMFATEPEVQPEPTSEP